MIGGRMPENKKRPAGRTSTRPESVARTTKKSPSTADKSATPAKTAAPKRKPKPSGPPLSILMVASEAHPYAKTGGLAEVVAALPDALARLGHRVTLVLPRYHGIDLSGARSQATSIAIGGRTQQVSFHSREERPGVTVVFVDVPELFDRLGGLYNVNGV